MNRLYFFLLAALLLLPASAAAATGPKSLGTFSTDFKDLTLYVDGSKVTGTYTHQDGRVEGTLKGHTITGRWTQSNGKGRFVFEFNDDFTAFTGKWSYNDAEPGSKWDGKLIPGTRNGLPFDNGRTSSKAKGTSGVFSSDFKDIVFYRDGDKVTGKYNHMDGRIEGTIKGHILTGRWTQSNGKGRFVFEFNDDFTAFTGKWSYNDAEPSGKWDGKLKPGEVQGLPSGGKGSSSKATISTRTYSSDFNDIVFHVDGNKVTGKYNHMDGRIEGTLKGHTLTGRWTQSNGKGRFVFEFNDDFTAFTGKWSYNDAEPSGRWNGSLR